MGKRGVIGSRRSVCVTDHIALRHLYSMQDTSNMVTRWAIALQSFDFTVEHKPGKLNVIPDTLSRLFNIGYSEIRVALRLAPICRDVTDNPALHGPPRLRPYQVNSHNLEIQPVESYHELFTRAIYVFMSIDLEKLRKSQQAEFGPYFEHCIYPTRRNNRHQANHKRPCRIVVKTGAFYIGLISPVIFVKKLYSAINLLFPAPVPMVLHACLDDDMSGGHIACKHTFDKVRNIFWRSTLHHDVNT